MYSKEEARLLKIEFWTTFAERFPRKWLLYDTKIKDFSFKFYVDKKVAKVVLDIEPKEDEKRIVYFEKITSLRSILLEEYLPDAIFEQDYYLESGKKISRIWVDKIDINMNRRSDWDAIFTFFSLNMDAFERFFLEYQDYISDLELNT